MGRTVTVQVQDQLVWEVYQGSSGHWIGVCDPLNLALEASSLDELESVIHEGTNLLFTDLVRDNELEQFLGERGWQASEVPRECQTEDVRFQVPWRMLVEPGDDSARGVASGNSI